MYWARGTDWSFISHVEKYLFRHHLHKNYFFLLSIIFAPLLKINWPYTCGSFSGWLLYDDLWIYLPVSTPVPHCFGYCGFMPRSQAMYILHLCRLSRSFGYSVFHVSMWILELSVSTEKSAGTLSALNL